jgi:hypothetical protein
VKRLTCDLDLKVNDLDLAYFYIKGLGADLNMNINNLDCFYSVAGGNDATQPPKVLSEDKAGSKQGTKCSFNSGTFFP